MPNATRTSLLAALAASLFLVASASASDVCGDVNDSGELSTSDALLVLRASVGLDVTLICEIGPVADTFGFTTDFVTSDTFGAGFLLGIPIEIDEQATITHFGIISKSSGQQVRFALYTDADDVPQDLVIGSSAATLVGGLQEIPVPATQVAAGTYWLMALYDKEAIVGSDFSGEMTVRLRAFDFEASFPNQFGSDQSYTGDRFNYYVKVQL
jgi:hypothetical protein